MNEPAPKRKWYYDIWFVVLMLFVLGPLAFPLLWKSEKFSPFMKWFLTIAFILITVFALWGTVEVIKLAWQEFKKLQDSLI